MAQGVLDVVKAKYWSFIPRRGSGRREERPDPPRPRRRGDRARARRGRADPDELTALFAEDRPEAIEDLRAAADELRAEVAGDTVTFVVNRNVNVSNVCIVGCAFCGFGQGKRSPDAYTHDREDFVAPPRRGRRLRRDRGLHPVGHPSRLGPGGLPGLAAPRPRGRAPAPPARLLADGGRAHVRRLRALAARVFAQLREAGLGSTPGTAAEVLHDGVRERISPNKLPVARWVEIIEASHARGPALDLHRDVRPHRGAVGARGAHARDPRAPGAHGRDHRVRARCPSSRSTRCSGAPTASRRSPARRTSSTPRCSAWRSDARSPTCRRAG